MSVEENVAQGRRFAQVLLTEHRLDQLDELVHEDFVEERWTKVDKGVDFLSCAG